MSKLNAALLRRLVALSLLVNVALIPSETAEAQNASSAALEAEAVVRMAFAELDSLRWAGAAALVHPVTLSRFRAWSLEQAREAERYRLDPFPRDPDMPPEVAAWFEERRRKAAEERRQLGSTLSYQFAGIDSLAQLEALTAEEMFARHLQANDPRELVKRQAMTDAREVPFATLRELDEMFHTQRTVIGAAVEDDSTVQVVYRTRFPAGSGEPAGIAVVAVRRTAEGWRLWTGSRDYALFDDHQGFGIVHIPTEAELQQQRRELANRVITWPLDGGGEGRAFVIGYTGGDEPPQALAIELQRPNATTVRVEVPAGSFERLAELLFGWPRSERR